MLAGSSATLSTLRCGATSWKKCSTTVHGSVSDILKPAAASSASTRVPGCASSSRSPKTHSKCFIVPPPILSASELTSSSVTSPKLWPSSLRSDSKLQQTIWVVDRSAVWLLSR